MRESVTRRERTAMTLIANIIWLIFGGLVTACGWALVGCLFYVSIIGIPLGRQCFKFARLTLAPFGVEIEYGGGAPSMVANIIWMILAGIPAAISYLTIALGYAVTIIGIPVAIQCVKMARLSLMPFGSRLLT